MTAAASEKHKATALTEKMYLAEEGVVACSFGAPEMGFAAGGGMRQEIYEDPYAADEWADVVVACNIWVCNSLAWRASGPTRSSRASRKVPIRRP